MSEFAESARRFLIRGRVQGVGFRWWCKRTAEELRLSGYVRNRSDGTVEVVADGDPGAIARFEKRLREGPSLARVDGVRSSPVGGSTRPGGTAEGFAIVP